MKLSICCITYNHAKFIKQALDGFFLQQTTFDYEIVISDDCSTDATLSIIESYNNNYPNRIKLLVNNRNIGMMPNFVQALNTCSGEYIALCEGDDYWTDPYKLQKQVDFLEANEDYAICFHKVYELHEGKEPELSNLNTSLKEECYTIEDLANGNFIHTPSVIFRNNLFKEFPTWFKDSHVGDYVLHMLNAAHGKIKFLPDAMAVYRVHNNGVWSSASYKYKRDAYIFILSKLIREDFSESAKEKLRIQLRNYTSSILSETFENDFSKFLEKLKEYCTDDDVLKDEWLFDQLPARINGFLMMKNSKVYKVVTRIMGFKNKYFKNRE